MLATVQANVFTDSFAAQGPYFASFQELRERYGHELMYLGFILLLLIAHLVGKRHNEVLAKSTMAAMLPLFRANFSRVGDNGAELAIDAPHEYIIYLTGRRHVSTVHGLIKMKPRQDLIRTVFTFFSSQLTAWFSFSPTKGRIASVSSLDSVKVISEASRDFWFEALVKAVSWLDYFIVSDQPMHKPETLPTQPYAKRISLSFRLPHAKNAREIIPLIEALIACLDGLAENCHVSTVIKSKISKAREEASKEIGKAAQAEKARELEEKRLREKREQEKNLSPEAQRKLAAKEEKRALKKRQKAVTKKA
ncbi:hypothetical protein BGZ70_007896 [Mortierella alpina]|uniref:DUF1682-domain-containing protein n=1 Tax=Mortierella alpina TaxID=64518 RepID=A0A9P6J502_MORAP|nr:hypothetical protein BGZ70_007896 [Mortierella alpina]